MSLFCSHCRITTPDDMSSCPACGRDLSTRGMIYAPSRVGRDETALASFYEAGRFGVTSRVSVPDDVFDLLQEIGGVVQSLLRLANNMSHSSGLTPTTRDCIRGCRDLATRLQEELETRRGP